MIAPSEDTLADLIAGHACAQLMDHSHGLMADRQARLNRILSADDVNVGATYGGQPHLDNCLADACVGNRLLLQTEFAGGSEDVGLHEAPC